MTSACVSYERTLPDAGARTAPHHLVINPVATERCREVCASSTRLDQVTTWQAADRYRNNEGPAVAREALAQLAISYRSEERRVGKECRSRWRREQKKKKKKSDGDDDCEY